MPVPVASAAPAGSAASSSRASAPCLGGHLAGQVGGEGVPRTTGGVAGADEGGHPGGVEPGEREGGPALGDGAGRPGVEGVGRQPHGLAVLVDALGEQAGDRRDLDEQARPGLVDLQVAGGRLEVADGQPAAAQHAGRLQPPVVEQQLHAAYDLEGRARRAARRRAPRRGRWSRPRAPRRAACASCARRAARGPTSPGRTRVPPSRGRSRRWAISSSTGVAASAGETVRRALPVVPSPPWSSTCASRARAAGESASRRAATSLGVGRLRRHRAQAAHPRGLVPAQRVGHPAQRAQPAGRLPGEREVDQPVDRGGRRRGLGVHHRDQLVRGGLTCNHEGIKHRELEAA